MEVSDTEIVILGSKWKVIFKDDKEDPNLEYSDGYCDHSCRKIVVVKSPREDQGEVSNFKAFQQRVLRHEIIHAYHIESGILDELTFNNTRGFPEVLVDWFAYQSPKIFSTFEELGLLEEVS